jgi:hypothetical protein
MVILLGGAMSHPTGNRLVAGLVAGLVSRFTTESFLRLFIFAYLGVLSHMVLDVLTPFGTAVLWPLSGRRFSMTLHHVIDPLVSALVLGFVIASYRLSSRRIFFARMGLAALAMFVVVTAVFQRAALSHWQEFVRSQGIEPIRSTVIPLFPGPIRWLGVSETNEAFYQQPFWLHGSRPKSPRIYPKTNVDAPELERLREVQLFLHFARYPWAQVWREGSFRVVEYQELAFADHPLGGPLSLKIWLDEWNNVKKVEFGHLF